MSFSCTLHSVLWPWHSEKLFFGFLKFFLHGMSYYDPKTLSAKCYKILLAQFSCTMKRKKYLYIKRTFLVALACTNDYAYVILRVLIVGHKKHKFGEREREVNGDIYDWKFENWPLLLHKILNFLIYFYFLSF